MIFFCEDCGAKNNLTEKYIDQGIVTFRCNACDYLNSYPLPGTTRDSVMNNNPSEMDGAKNKDTE